MPNTITKVENQGSFIGSNPPRRLHYFSPGLLAFPIVWSLVYFLFIPNPVEGFLRYYPLIAVGFGAALLGNISAVGGGLIFIPAMLFCFNLPAVMALKISLATQSIGMTSGSIGWYKTGKVPLKALLYSVPGLLIGSTISSLVIHPSALLVKTIFGPISILVGILTLLMLKGANQAKIKPVYNHFFLFLLSIVGGLITGWISIGEGEVIAAYLMLVCGLGAASSIGLGVILLAINSIYLTSIHSLFLGGIPWHMAAFTILGAVFGARVAPYLSQWISARILKIVFSIIAITDGIVFLIQAFSSHSLK